MIMPDAAEHGARYRGDEQGRMQRFWPILMNNFIEFPALQEAIRDRGWLADDRLAVAGASMGGMTALGIMTHHPELKSVACLMGSGYFSSLAGAFPSPSFDAEQLVAWDVSQQLATLASRPLLLWHGDEDDVVPPGNLPPAAGAAAKRAGRQFNLPLAERRPPPHYAGSVSRDGGLFFNVTFKRESPVRPDPQAA